MPKKYYTGIGARKTPEDILDLMTKVARYFHFEKYILRSGGADGADKAFELGAGENKEIFLPWKGFNDSTAPFVELTEEAYKIAEECHPSWNTCKDIVRKFHTRNVFQILGRDLKTPSDFVICWTRNGKFIGGTAQSIRIARKFEVPVFNLGIEEDKERILGIFKK